jgi:hypothetical protein
MRLDGDVNGSMEVRMSISGRLVMQRCNLGRFSVTSFSTRDRTWSRGDDNPVVSGHSSRASMMRYIGVLVALMMSSRHCVSASMLGCCVP